MSDVVLTLASAVPLHTLLTPAVTQDAQRVDNLFNFILALCALFFVLVTGATVLFAIKYRRRHEGQRTSPIKGNKKLEVIWAVVPAILLVIIFVWGFQDFLGMSVAPGDAMEVRVTAQKWSWSFDYPKDGITSGDLVVPAGEPVKLTMSSMDVIHSFYVPAFRIKRDILPNRYSVLWFNAEEPGTYDLMCAEYCGTNHSTMLAKVKVLTHAKYREWIDSGGGLSGKGLTSAQFGKLLFKSKGCTACHTVDGAPSTGPTLKDKYGTLERLAAGGSVKVDDNYLRESLMKPNAKVVHGFAPVMPTYAGRLKEKQVNALIDYIKSIGKK